MYHNWLREEQKKKIIRSVVVVVVSMGIIFKHITVSYENQSSYAAYGLLDRRTRHFGGRVSFFFLYFIDFIENLGGGAGGLINRYDYDNKYLLR